MKGCTARFLILKKNALTSFLMLIVVYTLWSTLPSHFSGCANSPFFQTLLLHENPNTRYSHVPSIEWYPRGTIDIHMLGDEDKKVTVYRTDYYGSTMNALNFWERVGRGDWELDTFKVLRYFLEGRPEDAYVDFGAWIGPTALYAAHFSHHVYAIEPDPIAYSALVANVGQNVHLARHIRTYFECINTDEGPISLRGKGDSVSSVTYPGGEGVQEWTIQCRTLPTFVEMENVRNIRLIKIDVEGAELQLLPSLRPWLETFQGPKPAIWLSVHQPFWRKDDPELEHKAQAFWDTMQLYKYTITDNKFSVVDHHHAERTEICKSFCEYLLTDEEFQML